MESVGSYQCGNCSKTFPTMCQLCKHLTSYDSSGSFYFNNILKIGYPKFDFVCKATQSDMSFSDEIDFKAFALLQKHKRKLYPIILGLENGADEISVTTHLTTDREVNAPKTQSIRSVQATRQEPRHTRRKRKLQIKDETDAVFKAKGSQKSVDLQISQPGQTRKPSNLVKDHVQYRLRSLGQGNAESKPEVDSASSSGHDVKSSTKHSEGAVQKTTCIKLPRKILVTKSEVEDEKLKTSAKEKKKILKLSKPKYADKAFRSSSRFEIDRTETSSSFPKLHDRKQCVVKVTQTWMPAHDVPDRIQKPAESHLPSITHGTSEQDTLMPEIDDAESLQQVSKSYLPHDEQETSKQDKLKSISDVDKIVVEAYPPHDLQGNREKDSPRPEIDVGDRIQQLFAEPYSPHQLQETNTKENLSAENVPQHPDLVIPEESDQLHTQNSEKLKNMTECEVCGRTIGKYSYTDHLNMHFGRTPFVCELCGKRLTSRKALGMHRLYSHTEDSLKKQCKFCAKTFPTKYGLEDHMLTHTKDKEFVCVKCGKVFFSKHSLSRHIVRMHEETKVVHNCPKCDKKFKTKPHLLEHIQSHSQVFTCETCGASFNRLSSKRRHVQTHTGSRDHKCHICGHEFIQKTPYWVHMEKHHDLTRDQLTEMFPRQHGSGRKYTVPESISHLEIQTHAAEDSGQEETD